MPVRGFRSNGCSAPTSPRLGPALAEEIDRIGQQASDDRQRERLRAVRYRLAASDALVLRWPGGLERLAATDPAQRRLAAEQLATLATEADQSLLLLLFADPDPLVRELCLRGLQRIGGAQSPAALAGLLADPEPNVRAAVLKLLEENPQPAMVPKVAEYLKTEKDPDLLVHAVRFLRVSGGATAIRAMMGLVDHQSWQVRAEAAAGLGRTETSFSSGLRPSTLHFLGEGNDDDATLQADAYTVLIRLLDDPDAFVVSRAVEGLADADLAVAVEPLVKAATKHPDLAVPIVSMLAAGEQMRPKAVPHLRRFAADEDARIRAAAIAGLIQAAPSKMDKELTAALRDQDARVRIAGAAALMALFERSREAAQQKIERRQEEMAGLSGMLSGPSTEVLPSQPSLVGRLRGALQSLFGPKHEEQLQPAPAKVDPSPPGNGQRAVPAEPPAEGTPPPPDTESPDGLNPPTTPPEDGQNGAVPALPDLTDPGPEWDRWLTDFYQGKGRPAMADATIEPLREMLAAKDARERMTAALALVPLGRVDEALPVVLETARNDPSLRGGAVAVLPWLVWQRRLETFHALRGLVEEDDSWQLVSNLVPVSDRRAAEVVWDLLGDPKMDRRLVGPLKQILQKIYLRSI